MEKIKTIICSFLLIISWVLTSNALAEHVTYKTYFPPPIDSFNELHFTPIVDPASCPSGTTYVSNIDNDLKTCDNNNNPQSLSTLWTRNGLDNVHPVDTSAFLGLGTDTANTAIQINFESTKPIAGLNSFGGLHLRQIGLNSGDFTGITSGKNPNTVDLGLYFVGNTTGTELKFLSSDDLSSRGLMTIKEDSKVGIGTSTPLTNLHFYTATNSNVDNHGFNIQNGASGFAINEGLRFLREKISQETIITQSPSKNLRIGTDATPNILFSYENHNIGVNIATPNYTLDVYGNVRFQGDLHLNDNADRLYSVRNGTITFQPKQNSTSNTGVKIYNAAGTRFSNIEVDGSNNAAGFRLSYNTTNNSTNTMLSITEKGVGINTAEPDYSPSLASTLPMLDVKGDIRAIGIDSFVKTEIRKGIYNCTNNTGNPPICATPETFTPQFSSVITEVNCNTTIHGNAGKKAYVRLIQSPYDAIPVPEWRVYFALGDNSGGSAQISYICMGHSS